MKKQFKLDFTEFLIFIKTIIFFILCLLFIFFLSKLYIKYHKIDWSQGYFSAYIMVKYFHITTNFYKSMPKMFLLMEVFYLLFLILMVSIFCIKFYNNYTFWKTFKKFYQKLPFKNKVFLFLFTIANAIPNKILINTNRRFATDFLGQGVFISFCYAEPLLGLFYVYFLEIFISNGFFAYMYENNFERYPLFQIKVKKYLFNSSDEFAKFYFDFFWGNMFSRFKDVGKRVYSFGIIGAFLNEKLKNERSNILIQHKSNYAEELDAIKSNDQLLDPELMKTLSDKALNEAIYHHGSTIFSIYKNVDKINAKIGDVVDNHYTYSIRR